MVTFLLLVWLNGNLFYSIGNIPDENTCYIQMEKEERLHVQKPGWIYNYQCLNIE